MGNEIGVQLGLIEAKRGGLAAGHRLLDGLHFLLHAGSGLRAGGNDRRRRGMKNHQQGHDCGGIGGPAKNAEYEAQSAGLGRRQLIGARTAAGYDGCVHDAAPCGLSAIALHKP